MSHLDITLIISYSFCNFNGLAVPASDRGTLLMEFPLSTTLIRSRQNIHLKAMLRQNNELYIECAYCSTILNA